MLPKPQLVGVTHAMKNVAFGNICHILFLHTKNEVSLTVHHVFSHTGSGHGSADRAASLDSMRLICDSNDDATRWPGVEIQISRVSQNSNCFERIKDRPSRVRQTGPCLLPFARCTPQCHLVGVLLSRLRGASVLLCRLTPGQCSVGKVDRAGRCPRPDDGPGTTRSRDDDKPRQPGRHL